MKKLNFCLIFVIAFSSCDINETDKKQQKSEQISTVKDSKQDGQADLNLSAEEQLILINKEMDSILNTIYSEYSENKEFTKNLKISQELWLKFHDAEMLVKYPENDPLRDGSAFNLCWYTHKIQLKKQRLENLKVWTIGEKEGEICSGSVKITSK